MKLICIRCGTLTHPLGNPDPPHWQPAGPPFTASSPRSGGHRGRRGFPGGTRCRSCTLQW
ncbi:hypothetical protein DIPPA_33882 [Diplonema papillatum]|nr:hypothetical protein DIPPA_33882 [Diplonema papillatum]